jgi:uncharacterized membrane protein YjgN (DUF898 family)
MDLKTPFDAMPLLQPVTFPTALLGPEFPETAPPETPTLPAGDIPVAFHGTTHAYFPIWVVCQFYTFITLGLYAPWAKARKARYLAQSLTLNGVAFDVTLNPLAILKGRLIALAAVALGLITALAVPSSRPFLVAAAFVGLPWLLSRSMAFRWWRSSFAGRRFGFTPTTKPLWKAAFVVGAGAVLAVIPQHWAPSDSIYLIPSLNGLGYFIFAVFGTYLTTALLYLRLSRAQYGKHAFHLDATPWQIYKKLFKTNWRGFGFVFILYIALMIGSGAAAVANYDDLGALMRAAGVLMITVFGVASARTQRFNFVMEKLRVGDHLSFVSTLDPSKTARKSMWFALINVASLGLTVPYTTIEMLKWRTQHVRAHLTQPWEEFVDAGAPQAVGEGGALADGLAEQFDFELSL